MIVDLIRALVVDAVLLLRLFVLNYTTETFVVPVLTIFISSYFIFIKKTVINFVTGQPINHPMSPTELNCICQTHVTYVSEFCL